MGDLAEEGAGAEGREHLGAVAQLPLVVPWLGRHRVVVVDEVVGRQDGNVLQGLVGQDEPRVQLADDDVLARQSHFVDGGHVDLLEAGRGASVLEGPAVLGRLGYLDGQLAGPFELAGSLGPGRILHTATRLADGRVLTPLGAYYWVMLLMVPMGRGRWVPTAAWMGLNTALYALHYFNMEALSFEMIYGLLSWALAAYFLAWMAPDAWKTAREGWTWVQERKT